AEQGCMHGIGQRPQMVGGMLASGDGHARETSNDQTMQGLLARHGVKCVQVIDFGSRKHLYPVGMDEIKVADQSFLRVAGVFTVKSLDTAVAPRDPLEVQFAAVVLKQLRYSDFRHAVAS